MEHVGYYPSDQCMAPLGERSHHFSLRAMFKYILYSNAMEGSPPPHPSQDLNLKLHIEITNLSH
jgi:hypothetical protein